MRFEFKIKYTIAACLALFVILLAGCERSGPTQSSENVGLTPYSAPNTFSGNGRGNGGNGGGGNNGNIYPLNGDVLLPFKNNGDYGGGSITLGNGMKLTVMNAALTPPEELYGQAVDITFTCKKPKPDELVVEFGPHGSEFIPPVQLVLDWSDLGIDLATLYYIDDNNNYVEQEPDDIDIVGKKMYLYLHHFSRYAISGN